MRTGNYRQIEVPLRLLLEFERLTVGELSNVLRQYQALLRLAWQDTCEDQDITTVPPVRLLTVSASTEHPIDLFAEFAIPALYFSTEVVGPVIHWPGIVHSTFQYIRAIWSGLTRRPEARASGQIFIQGGETPQLTVPVSALMERDVANRIQDLWRTAQSGAITVTLELPDGDERATYRPD